MTITVAMNKLAREHDARAVLEQVVALGGEVTWADGLKVRNAGNVPQEVRDQWAEHRETILELLTRPMAKCAVCGADGYAFGADATPVCEKHEERWT